ncbi:MAG: hypothetical protein ACMXYL_05280 [Candidatus Woesearchaeota archaeon]
MLSEADYLFHNPDIDFLPRKAREAILYDLFKSQVEYVRREVMFYATKYAKLDISRIKNYHDFGKVLPPLFKEEIRTLNSPYDLIGNDQKKNMGQIHFHRGTGGTTGEPTSMFFTNNDWTAVLGAMTRSLIELKMLDKQIIAFNGYNQGHISGPIFDDTIRLIGGFSIARHFVSDDITAVKSMKKHNCNVIIAPAQSTHKGGSIQDLLDADATSGTNYINGDNIDAILCSSTNLSRELYDELTSLGIKIIYNYYGSTDALPTAISCQHSPLDLHILEGHISLFVVNEEYVHAKNNERGLVFASRIGGYDDNGALSLQKGTQMLNFITGDEVTFIDEPCKCGRTTPRIRDIKRVKYQKEKIEGGCEVW